MGIIRGATEDVDMTRRWLAMGLVAALLAGACSGGDDDDDAGVDDPGDCLVVDVASSPEKKLSEVIG